MSTSPITSAALASFNGSSTYAADLQQAINQAVTIASIPLAQVQDNVILLQAQTVELNTLQGDFGGLQTAIQSLDSASGSAALAGSVSNGAVASVSVNSSAQTAGTYQLNII